MNKTSKLKDVTWRKISAPKTWRPNAGEELLGYYAGRTKRDGKYGQYEVLTVLVPYHGMFLVSGTQLIQLADSAMLTRGDAIRIVFTGYKELSEDRQMKLFDLFIGEDAALSETELPAC